jgi:hypothetical protein
LSSITPIILCGGSGTRLWPLSRKSFPKQFVPLIGNKSLLQLTLERVSLLSKNVICVASDEHRFLVAEAMQAAKVQGAVLLEPVARNTAAAMAIAATSQTLRPLPKLSSKALPRHKRVLSSLSVFHPLFPALPTATFVKAALGQTAHSTSKALRRSQP